MTSFFLILRKDSYFRDKTNKDSDFFCIFARQIIIILRIFNNYNIWTKTQLQDSF
jgi:hypothetical protein